MLTADVMRSQRSSRGLKLFPDNIRDMDTADQMVEIVAGMVGKHLTYRALIKDKGLSSGARSAWMCRRPLESPAERLSRPQQPQV